ncbi:ADP-ribosylation factor family-domain-containing protein [Mortierella sp. GBAus27b]|nr:ADP-ribosylation factor family-domain-containing protein [Mortierella sp. GBAus27b]
MGSTLSASSQTHTTHTTHTVMIGLENAGKTSILYYLKLGLRITAIPTYSYNVESVSHDKWTLKIYDLGGRNDNRTEWPSYLENATGLIFVVDSSNTTTLEEARGALWRTLHELDDKGSRIPLLVYANKQDDRFGATVAEVRDALGLKDIQGHEWHIVGTSVIAGYGIRDGLDWYVANAQL